MKNAAELYGKSLYELSREEGLDQRILSEMRTVGKLFSENPDYIRLLSEPSLPKLERLSLLDKAFRGSIEPYFLNFLKLLVERGLLSSYSGAERTFKNAYNRDHGILEATVFSAVALTEEERRELLSRLRERSGKEVELTEKLDSSLLGGLLVEIDGKRLDGTVSGRLSAIRRKLDEYVL